MFPLMYSPKDTHTSVIYWGIIWSPVAWNISGLGLLASTQNDVWSEELHLWKKNIINSVLDLSLNAYCKKIFELCIGAAETELKHTYTWTHTLSRSLISTVSSQSSGLPGGGRRQIQTEEEMGKKGVLDREDWTRQFSAPRGWTCMAGLIG